MSNERNSHRTAVVLFAVAVIIAIFAAFVTTLERVDTRTANNESPPGTTGLAKPRPPLDREVSGYERHTHRRLLIKPGITGLWQINGRSDLAWEEAVRLDLYYVENWSIAGDLFILWRTFRAVIKPSGAY